MKLFYIGVLLLNLCKLSVGVQYYVTKIYSIPLPTISINTNAYTSGYTSGYNSGSVYQSGSFYQSGIKTPVPTPAPSTSVLSPVPPTSVPTPAPSTPVPTSVPTPAPSTSVPTPVPTTLAYATQPILNFMISGTLTNISTTTLSIVDKQSICQATAKTMNISNIYVTFIDTYRRKLILSNNINFNTEINYPLKNKDNAQTVYQTLTQTLVSGNFNTYLYMEATKNNATNILNAVVTNITSTEYIIINTINKEKNTNGKTSFKHFLFFLFLILSLPLSYLKYRDCKKKSEPQRKYNNRRDYYFRMLFSNSQNDNFTPVSA